MTRGLDLVVTRGLYLVVARGQFLAGLIAGDEVGFSVFLNESKFGVPSGKIVRGEGVVVGGVSVEVGVVDRTSDLEGKIDFG